MIDTPLLWRHIGFTALINIAWIISVAEASHRVDDYAGAAPYHAPYDAPCAASPALRYVDGYIYVLGRGILDEACGLPTSSCPNNWRVS